MLPAIDSPSFPFYTIFYSCILQITLLSYNNVLGPYLFSLCWKHFPFATFNVETLYFFLEFVLLFWAHFITLLSSKLSFRQGLVTLVAKLCYFWQKNFAKPYSSSTLSFHCCTTNSKIIQMDVSNCETLFTISFLGHWTIDN